jgi:phosphoheptose isomerase
VNAGPRSGVRTGADHVDALADALGDLRSAADELDRWGRRLAGVLVGGGRLLVAGNGGSAAEAQHLTAEVVGRYRADRQPLAAIALHADSSTVTALVNDFPPELVFARQVRAHGRAGDVLLCISSSGCSPNLLAAADAAHGSGLVVWALTGPAPNPLAEIADEVWAVASDHPPTVQECQLVAVHLVAAGLDAELTATPACGDVGNRRP